MAYFWLCKKGKKALHTSKNTWEDRELAQRAADNHVNENARCLGRVEVRELPPEGLAHA